VDILRCLLLDFGADSRQIIDFFQLHDAKQACAMCLTIICTSSLVDGNVHEAALRAFFLYGGDPTMASFAPNAEPMSPPPTPHLDWSRNGSIADWSHNIRCKIYGVYDLYTFSSTSTIIDTATVTRKCAIQTRYQYL
jgi:hypothetical protein